MKNPPFDSLVWGSLRLAPKFKRAYLKFPVSGRSIRIDRHTSAQCSHASVGLAQARPN